MSAIDHYIPYYLNRAVDVGDELEGTLIYFGYGVKNGLDHLCVFYSDTSTLTHKELLELVIDEYELPLDMQIDTFVIPSLLLRRKCAERYTH